MNDQKRNEFSLEDDHFVPESSSELDPEAQQEERLRLLVWYSVGLNIIVLIWLLIDVFRLK